MKDSPQNLLIQETQLETPPLTCEKIDALNEMARNLRNSLPEDSLRLSQKAYDFSQSGEFAHQPYREGMATALANIGLIDTHAGRLDQALEKNFHALSLLDGLPLSLTWVSVWYNLCWVYIHIGDFPEAIKYALKMLQLTRDLGAPDREAKALDNLGSIFSSSGDLPQSVAYHEEAQKIFQAIGEQEGEAFNLNNLSWALTEMGEYHKALAASMRSLELAQQLHITFLQFISTIAVCDIFIQLGDYDKAGDYLEQARQISLLNDNQLNRLTILNSMARLAQAQKNFEDQEKYLIEALSIAEQCDYKQDQLNCHHLLSEMYEMKDMPHLALAHFKKFFKVKEILNGTDTVRRVATLRASYQIELHKREAEIYLTKNMELQHEIDERKRAEALLEHLAIYDPLTNLINRRHFTVLALQELERANHHHTPLAVLLLDVDYFKVVNDTYGHLIGDQVLTQLGKILPSILRKADVAARWGGEEFVLLLSDTTCESAITVAERLRRLIQEARINTRSGDLGVTVSIGISLYTGAFSQPPDEELEKLLHEADLALYRAKREGRNRTILFTADR